MLEILVTNKLFGVRMPPLAGHSPVNQVIAGSSPARGVRRRGCREMLIARKILSQNLMFYCNILRNIGYFPTAPFLKVEKVYNKLL